MTANKQLPYGRQWIDEDDIAAVTAVLRGDWLTQGPAVERFEAALAEVCSAKHAVVVTNGTVALHLACRALDIGPGDEGITSPITFIASANCLVYCGGKPVFADIDAVSWNIDPAEIERSITPRTKVLIPVHFGGLPCDMPAIAKIARRHGLRVIEDACHALGATYDDIRVGSCAHSELVVFSFHPVKHITTGEGGAILTNDTGLASRLRTLRHHGISKSAELSDGAPWYYEISEIGFNARLTDIHCALGLSQLKKLDRYLARRRDIAALYREALEDLPGMAFQQVPGSVAHAYHLFAVHLAPEIYDRRKAFDSLRARGVLPQVHYVPSHQQPAMRRICGEQRLPNAERYYQGCLSLPMYPRLTDDDVSHVVASVKAAVLEATR
jgi:UDP-4-amino-4,6-dideoxy-N-acetyl-beta-L-altrosamine transaminase